MDITTIYNNLVNRFYKKTKIDVKKNDVIDMYLNASAELINDAYTEIDNNKTPYIFSGLSGNDIDNSLGVILNIPREPDEKDDSYLYRVMNWTSSRENGNLTAITLALMNLDYSSNVTYIPLTEGVGTATAYIIPKNMDNSEEAIEEVKTKLNGVVSPSTHVSYIIPAIRSVKLIIYIKTNGDSEGIKSSLTTKIKTYINSIAPGSYLDLGEINRIGVNENNVSYFNLTELYIDDSIVNNITTMQMVDSKFLFDEIEWWTVNK